MTAFDFRDDRQRSDMIDAIADSAWGAIKSWQTADEDRLQLDATTVRDATEDYLRQVKTHPDCEALCHEGERDILARLNRADARMYL